MADKFDKYREALVMEEETIWPAEYENLTDEQRYSLERKLHDTADQAALLEYVRTHTGFARKITVTEEDFERVS